MTGRCSANSGPWMTWASVGPPVALMQAIPSRSGCARSSASLTLSPLARSSSVATTSTTSMSGPIVSRNPSIRSLRLSAPRPPVMIAILARAAERLAQRVALDHTGGLVVGPDVHDPVAVGRVGVERQHQNALFETVVDDVDHRGRVVRRDDDGVDAPGNQVLDHPHLQRRVKLLRRLPLEGDPQRPGFFLGPDAAILEERVDPLRHDRHRDPRVIGHHGHRRKAARRRTARRRRRPPVTRRRRVLRERGQAAGPAHGGDGGSGGAPRHQPAAAETGFHELRCGCSSMRTSSVHDACARHWRVAPRRHGAQTTPEEGKGFSQG